jgi:RHS repeat-associated protein
MNITSTPPSSNPTFLNFSDADGLSSYEITNTAGEATNFYIYDPNGEDVSGNQGSAFGYAGQYEDTSSNQSGFDNMRARWYDNQTGTFTTVDPAYS